MDYDSCIELTPADKYRILHWEDWFKDDSSDAFMQYLLFWNVSGSNKIFSKSVHSLHIVLTHIPKL